MEVLTRGISCCPSDLTYPDSTVLRNTRGIAGAFCRFHVNVNQKDENALYGNCFLKEEEKSKFGVHMGLLLQILTYLLYVH